MRGHRATVAPAALLAVMTAITTSCAANNKATHSHVHAPVAVPSPAGRGVIVTDKDNGRRIELLSGESLTLVLDSTYWTIDGPDDPSVLRAARHAGTSPGDSCMAGVGCGEVRQIFVARQPGTTTLRASRTVCGEAMACSPDQSHFAVRVRVS